jgi:hypothetical protein
MSVGERLEEVRGKLSWLIQRVDGCGMSKDEEIMTRKYLEESINKIDEILFILIGC